MKKQKLLFYSSLLCSTLTLAPSLSNAAGFAIVEQNVSSLGNAYAGASSIANDASTVFYNPAGMTQLSGRHFSAGLHAIKPTAKFSNINSNVSSGGNGGDAGGTEIVPNFYFVTPVSDKAKFGIGINSPFGLSTEYDANWIGRYHAIKSQVKTININPSIGFSTNTPFSFGVGMDIQYMDAELTRALNFSVLNPAFADGFAKVKGDNWGIGYNFGVLFAPQKESRIGFTYRSQVKHKLNGSGEFTVPDTVLAADPRIGFRFANTDATAEITLPESWALSSYHELTKKWELLGEITFTKWSQVQELIIDYENPYNPNTVEELKFRNTYRYAIGANFKPNDRFIYRLGFAFDEGAAPNATYRSPRIPDHDRTWLALGLGYHQNAISFDVGYAHLFVDDSYINRTNETGDTLNGKYELSVDILSAQFNYAF
jgi:long-chain fatty acid transport protein